MGSGTRHWLEETASGAVGVFHGGDEHDALYAPGSLYATATLSLDRLEQLAADDELILDRPVLGGTGLHAQPLESATLTRIRHVFELIHKGSCDAVRETRVGQELLRALIAHLGRAPRVRNRLGRTDAHAMIVRRARAYVLEHLAEPISPDALAKAALTSRRILFRAFAEKSWTIRPILGVAPKTCTASGRTSPATRSEPALSRTYRQSMGDRRIGSHVPPVSRTFRGAPKRYAC